jgi:arylsulfatase A-like enzyme
MKTTACLLILLVTMPLRAAQPNFVLMLSDDQTWNGLSVQMHPDIENSKSHVVETPNLEHLARQGMVFSSAYAPAPVCSPTRISLQTGQTPARLHWTKAAPSVDPSAGYQLITPRSRRHIDKNETTIAEQLHREGYRTAHYGKWHIGGGGPEAHGYDESDGDTGNRDAAPFTPPNPVDIFGMGERAVKFMEKSSKAKKPFFIQLSYHALHYPQNALPETIEKYRDRMPLAKEKEILRAAMAENLDAGVGHVLDAIDTLGLAPCTYVIFMSDNGGGGGRGGKRGNRILSGGKGSLGEGGIRVPFIVRGPGVKAGSYCDVPVIGYDLLPTFCSLSGSKDSQPETVDGGNIAPLFSDGKGHVERPGKGLFFHFPHYQGDSPQSAIRAGDYKLVKWYETGEYKLYNLSKDLGEKDDLSKKMPEKTSELKELIETYLKTVDAQIPEPNPKYDPNKAEELKKKKAKDRTKRP